MMKIVATLATLVFGLAAASAQVIPYFPPFLSSLPDLQLRREAAVEHKFTHDSRFSIPASDDKFIRFVIQRAKAQRRTVRTARQWVRGTEFVNIWTSERK
jgi:hypothetical protein